MDRCVHVEELCKKLSQRTAVLRKIRIAIHPYCNDQTNNAAHVSHLFGQTAQQVT